MPAAYLCGCETPRRLRESNASARIESVQQSIIVRQRSDKMRLALTDEDGPSLFLFVAVLFPLQSVEHCLTGLRAQWSAKQIKQME